MGDKYDDAIEFLYKLNDEKGGNTYFGECADIMNELLCRVTELEERYVNPPPKKSEWRKEHDKKQELYGKANAKRARDYWERARSSAIADKE